MENANVIWIGECNDERRNSPNAWTMKGTSYMDLYWGTESCTRVRKLLKEESNQISQKEGSFRLIISDLTWEVGS